MSSARAGSGSDFQNEAQEKEGKRENRDGRPRCTFPLQTRPGAGPSICLGRGPSCALQTTSRIYLYIYSWICFARRGPVWLGRPLTTGPSGPPPGSVLKNPDRVQKPCALVKNKHRNISPLHNSFCRRKGGGLGGWGGPGHGSELLQAGRVRLHGWRRVMTKQGEGFFFFF